MVSEPKPPVSDVRQQASGGQGPVHAWDKGSAVRVTGADQHPANTSSRRV